MLSSGSTSSGEKDFIGTIFSETEVVDHVGNAVLLVKDIYNTSVMRKNKVDVSYSLG